MTTIKTRRQPTFLFLQDTLPPEGPHSDSRLLGRFVADPLRPTDNFAPDTKKDNINTAGNKKDDGSTDGNKKDDGKTDDGPHARILSTAGTVSAERMSVEQHLKAQQSTRALARLQHLLTLGGSVERSAEWKLDTQRVITRRLRQQGRVFKVFMRDDSIKDEVLELLRDNDDEVYMVVATRAYVDATVTVNGGVAKQAELKAELPVDKATTAASGAPAGKAMPNPSINASVDRSADWAGKYTVPGERIFQVQYRVIRLERQGLFGLWRPTGSAKFDHIAGVEAGSGTFHGSGSSSRGHGSAAIVGIDEDEDENDSNDGDGGGHPDVEVSSDEVVRFLEEDLKLDGAILSVEDVE